jgi:hypothetical protein
MFFFLIDIALHLNISCFLICNLKPGEPKFRSPNLTHKSHQLLPSLWPIQSRPKQSTANCLFSSASQHRQNNIYCTFLISPASTDRTTTCFFLPQANTGRTTSTFVLSPANTGRTTTCLRSFLVFLFCGEYAARYCNRLHIDFIFLTRS